MHLIPHYNLTFNDCFDFCCFRAMTLFLLHLIVNWQVFAINYAMFEGKERAKMTKLVATQRLEAIRPNSLAQKAGLQRGDYVLAVCSSSLAYARALWTCLDEQAN